MGKTADLRLKFAKVGDEGGDRANRRVKYEQGQRSESVNEKPEPHKQKNTGERKKLRAANGKG